MKRWRKLLAVLLAMAVALSCVPSYGLEVKAAVSGDFKYEVNEDGNSVEITGYAGSGGDIVIPAEIDGKEVTSIKWAAFYGCSGITGVTIPRSVTSIAGYTFANCSGLERIMVDEENPRYDSRNGCNALIESGSNTLVFGCKNTVIPNSVTSIGASAFFGRSGLTEVIIPDGVTSIGDSAFCGCSDLTGLIIPDSVTSIGASAFSSCRGLTGVVIIPDGVTSIGYRAFEYCSGLMEVIIPDSVTSIGWQAFAYCRGLTGVTIPSSVTSIGDHAFSDCRSLESILVEEENPKYDSRGNCNALIESESNTLICGCKNTVIPNGVTSIVDRAFYGCSGLMGVMVIPDSVTSIGMYAFYDCIGLTGAVIPDSVTSISLQALGCFRSDDGEHEEMTDFIIYGTSGSEAERYAKGYGLTFLLSSDWELSGGGNDKNDISGAGITLEKTSYLYDGKPKTPSVTVTLDGKKLVFNTDYTVAYRNNTDAGTAMITVTGQGCYTGSKTVGFTIVKAEGQPDTSITCKKTLYKIAYGVKPFKITASSGSKMEFSSSNPKIAAVDKETGKVTVRNTGIATITIKAGEASKKVTVKVRPKKQSLKQAKAVKGRKLTVKWSKDKRASGYQVQISTDKKFKGNVKSKNLSKTSYTFTKLKTGRKYYARVRSYKKSGKETLYGAWSAAKSGGNVKK